MTETVAALTEGSREESSVRLAMKPLSSSSFECGGEARRLCDATEMLISSSECTEDTSDSDEEDDEKISSKYTGAVGDRSKTINCAWTCGDRFSHGPRSVRRRYTRSLGTRLLLAI